MKLLWVTWIVSQNYTSNFEFSMFEMFAGSCDWKVHAQIYKAV